MGIRFYCPTCNRKLNVKTFLAGKRGICPHCGGSVNIPAESQLGAGAPRYQAANPQAAYAGQAAVAEQPAVSTAPVGASIGTPTATAAAAPAAAPVTPSPAPARNGSPVDPIAEAPEATWYVRPPSGGQYGPAKGEIMRKWIAEGRVSADSLVWREGWDDWQEAAPLFPSLSNTQSGAAPAPSPAPVNAFNDADLPAFGGSTAPQINIENNASEPKTSPRARQQKKSGLTMAVVVTLVILIVTLLIVLFWVLAGR